MATPGSTPKKLLVSSRYSIQRKLGAGSMGAVYLARDEASGRLVALKLIEPDRFHREGLDQLQREFKAFAALHHPQIAAAYDFGYTKEGGLPYYTREYVAGKPLSPGPPDPARHSPGEFLKPVLDLLDALQYLHSHDILHLDIHSGNLIEADDAARGGVLIDFGLLEALQGAESPRVLRLKSSLPPELLSGEPVGPAADVYSAGRLLLYRLTGSFEGDASMPHEIRGWDSRVTLDLERIIEKTLQRNPARRFRSASELLHALNKALGETGQKPSLAEPGELTVGREAEISAIDAAIQDAREGKSALCWLSGPAGMGKSRLLAEARVRAQLRGLETVEARFYGDTVAGSPLLRALRASGRSRSAAPAWLRLLLPRHGGSSAERARRAAEACFAEDSPSLVLILDDLDWADQESSTLADALIAECIARRSRDARGRGVAIFASTILEPASRAARVLRRLRPLPAKQTRQLFEIMLRPLKAPVAIASGCARLAQGNPGRIRRLAQALRTGLERGGKPHDARGLLESLARSITNGPTPLREIGDENARVMRALLVLGRPARREEVAAATALSPGQLSTSLRRLQREEVLILLPQSGGGVFLANQPEALKKWVGPPDPGEARLVHERMIRFIRKRGARDLWLLEHLPRHLFEVGRRDEGRAESLRGARRLRERGWIRNAIRVISSAAAREDEAAWKLRFAEELSALHQECGDHAEGIQALEPIHRSALAGGDREAALRIRRRLGVHYHRSGRPAEAAALFAEVRASADPLRDVEELVFVESELAELHTLRGEYGEAEEACRRGLSFLEPRARLRREFRGSMEVMLRASLGHLHLRRTRLASARKELETALSLARRHGNTALRALILHNLGIVHNQLNDFPRARSFHVQAATLLDRLGDRSGVIHAECNLATIAAKEGDAAGARGHLERATELYAHCPGARLDFMVELARGMTMHFLGDSSPAMEAFEAAIPKGRALGDAQFTSFAEVYLAEAQLVSGLVWEAGRRLRATAESAKLANSTIVERMATSRLVLVESLMGRRGAAGKALKSLSKLERGPVELLEAWNDIFLGAAALLSADVSRAEGLFESARRVLEEAGVPAGARLARAGLLCCALSSGDERLLRQLTRTIESAEESPHKLVGVMEPVLIAQSRLALGELERAEDAVSLAAGAIVGLPFLELDGRIELLRAQIADRRGDRESARRFIHRSLHSRDLLARSVPVSGRRSLLSQPRFACIEELSERLKRPRLTPTSLKSAARSGNYHGLVGRSASLTAVLETIDRLRDQDLPVLILGETGTGKELVARALHRTGPRRTGPFFALHCASLPAELFESELFGYEAGAFTGADQARPGLLDTLAGGTLLLDEVSSLTPEMQAKLLGVVESKRVRPLGGTETKPVDVRHLASSSADLEDLVSRGRFRADLFHRFSVIVLKLPPLRARKEDIVLLSQHFLEKEARRLNRPRPLLTSDAVACLEDFEWPGNVRQLESVLLRAMITLSHGEPVSAKVLKPHLTRPRGKALFPDELLAGGELTDLRRELDRAYLTRLFRETQGDLERMAAKLGVKASNLYPWFRRVGIEIRELRQME